MKISRLVLALGAIALASTSSARAEFFEFSSAVTLSGPLTPGTATIAGTTFNSGSGNAVTLTALSSNPAVPRLNGAFPGGTDIVYGDINANAAGPVEQIGFNYTFTLTLTDFGGTGTSLVPLGTGVFTITGRLAGGIGTQSGSPGVNLENLNFASSPATQQIGNSIYTVTVTNATHYAGPGIDNNGRLGANVSARAIPEPGSLALLGLGGVGLAAAYRRRKAKASA